MKRAIDWGTRGAALLLVLISAACSPAGALRSVTQGDEVAVYNFATPHSFEEGAYDGAVLRVIDGVYRVRVTDGTNALWWGQWGDSYDNVIIEADAQQTSERPETAYGLMCRVRGTVGQSRTPDPDMAALAVTVEATPEATAEVTPELTPDTTPEATIEATPEMTPEATADLAPAPIVNEGDGYLFLVQGTGQVAIARARGRAVQTLTDWTTSSAVQTGQVNRLRAECVGDYLAFYVNGTLVAQTTDTAYQRGQIGLAASAANRLGAVIDFDNVQVWRATGG